MGQGWGGGSGVVGKEISARFPCVGCAMLQQVLQLRTLALAIPLHPL